MSDKDETQVDISGSQQVDSGGNQDQATDQEELNPQDNDVIGPQASKDDPPPGLPTPAQSPEPQLNIPITAPPATPITIPPATPIAAPATPVTPPSPQPQQLQQLQQLRTHTPPKLAVPSVEQGPRQGPGYSKEVATIAKIYADDKLVTACQGVPACPTTPLGTQIPTPMTPQPPVASTAIQQQAAPTASQQQPTLPQPTLPQPTLPQPTLPQPTLQQQSDPGIDKLSIACQGVPVRAYNSIGVG